MEGLPDYTKRLPELQHEWHECTRCSLGEYREEVGGKFVAGEGGTRSVMFIGEGPGVQEEAHGRPFVGKSGDILRTALAKLRLPAYLTNLVGCRSCGRAYDREGNLKYRKDRRGSLSPMIQDMPPNPAQISACSPRLNEEIYLVDPLLIVALGAEASKALTRKAVSVVADSGQFYEVTIPGAGFHPALTPKKKVWARKVRGQLVMPAERNTVRYLMMPLMHPAYIARRHTDARHGNPLQTFIDGMNKASGVYQRYLQETSGFVHVAGKLNEGDLRPLLIED